MLVHDFLINSASRNPDKIAVICGTECATYGQLDRRSNQLGRALIEAGVSKGDRVLVYLPNSIETAVTVFAILKAGAVFVPVNPGTKTDKLSFICANCKATAIVTDWVGAEKISDRWGDLVSVNTVVCTQVLNEIITDAQRLFLPTVYENVSAECLSVPVIDQDLACLIYTSGSTGEPKGVVCGHNNVVFVSGAIVSYLENVAEDVVLNALPFSFDYGLYQLLMVFRFGGTLVIENAFAFPAAILRSIARDKVTGLPAVPTLVSMLLKLDLSAFDLSSLRYITNTAAALHPSHILSLQQHLPHVRIYSMYGMTECKRTLYLPPERLSDKPSSVGVAIPGTEVWIEDEDARRLGPGEIGELVVRGGHVMRGYWDDPQLTARFYRYGPTLGERVLRSGDLFRRDEEGMYYFVSRKDDIIKSRGEKVAPKEVEAVISELPNVYETAVIGVTDELLGQAIVAYIVRSDSSLTEQQIRRHCSSRLESFMVPQRIEFVGSLAKNASGKIDKKGLVALHA